MFEDFPQFVPQKICLSCQGCCRFLDEKSDWRPRESEGRVKTKKIRDVFYCQFLEEKSNKCSEYFNRPLQCVFYPFLVEKKEDKIVVGVHLACPFIQENLHMKDFDIYRKKLEGFLKEKNFIGFLKDNEYLVEDYSSYQAEIETLFSL